MMKKSIFLILLLLAMLFEVSAFEVSALGEYGVPSSCFRYYSAYGGGYAGAKYCGTTENLTLDKVHNNRWQSSFSKKELESFDGKLSKRQSYLAWSAIEQYDYEPGEIYSVGFYEGFDTNHYYAITCQINSDGSFTWLGFSFYEQ